MQVPVVELALVAILGAELERVRYLEPELVRVRLQGSVLVRVQLVRLLDVRQGRVPKGRFRNCLLSRCYLQLVRSRTAPAERDHPHPYSYNC